LQPLETPEALQGDAPLPALEPVSMHEVVKSPYWRLQMDYVTNTDDLGARQSAIRNNLKVRRLAIGYSSEELAIATGLTVKEIEEAESSDSIDVHHLQRIEHVLR
jgi:hypothetical protein